MNLNKDIMDKVWAKLAELSKLAEDEHAVGEEYAYIPKEPEKPEGPDYKNFERTETGGIRRRLPDPAPEPASDPLDEVIPPPRVTYTGDNISDEAAKLRAIQALPGSALQDQITVPQGGKRSRMEEARDIAVRMLSPYGADVLPKNINPRVLDRLNIGQGLGFGGVSENVRNNLLTKFQKEDRPVQVTPRWGLGDPQVIPTESRSVRNPTRDTDVRSAIAAIGAMDAKDKLEHDSSAYINDILATTRPFKWGDDIKQWLYGDKQ